METVFANLERKKISLQNGKCGPIWSTLNHHVTYFILVYKGLLEEDFQSQVSYTLIIPKNRFLALYPLYLFSKSMRISTFLKLSSCRAVAAMPRGWVSIENTQLQWFLTASTGCLAVWIQNKETHTTPEVVQIEFAKEKERV